MDASFNLYILSSNDPEIYAVDIYKDDKNKNGYIKIDNANISLDLLKVLHLRDYVCRIKGVDDFDKNNLKLWKLTDNEEKIGNENIFTENDITQKLKGEEMKVRKLFREYFQDELNNKNMSRSSIITIIPAATALGKCLNGLLLEQETCSNSSFFIRLAKRKINVLNSDAENTAKKEKLDLVSPESIVKFLTEGENEEWIKTDFRKPNSLCANKFGFERKGREDSFHKAYVSIMEQYQTVQGGLKSSKTGIDDKMYFPLFALQSAPGGGKSYFLDEFASLKEDDLDDFLRRCQHENFHYDDAKFITDQLRDSVSICISYNGMSSYNATIAGDGDEIGLVMRIIWSYFFDGIKLPWNSFYFKFKGKFDSLDILKTIKSIILHSGKSVLLCVDEIMKIDNENHSRVVNLLNSLYIPYKDLMTKEKVFKFIVSTLDAPLLRNTQTTASGRPISWIPLRKLEFSESIALFSKFIEELERLGQENADRVFIIKKCISDCNGHPRTLESLYSLLNGNETVLKTANFAAIIEMLINKITNDYITFPVVKLALLGEYVRLDEEVAVTTKNVLMVKDLITSGVYINSLTNIEDSTQVIPTLNLVGLYYFCTKNKVVGDAKAVAEILKNIFHTEDYFDTGSNDGKAFEKFHMNWELLYRALQDSTEEKNEADLHEIYGLPSQGVKIITQRKNIVKLQRDIEFSPNGDIIDIKGNVIEDQDLEKYMFVPIKSNNSGFEMAMFEKKANGRGYIAINIECRFSWPDSETTLSNKIVDKYNRMKTKYLPHVKSGPQMVRRSKGSEVELTDSRTCIGKLGMVIEDIYLILVVWRNIGTLSREVMDNENIIVVKKENLEKIYSPSLVSRPQFYGYIRRIIEN
ncbi:hypothetical protein GLOIN_2v1783590 [Rhizophagus clarus]|nr:hypothetical protein GLOIN_2v1783590 [Rhizophagus clarus]